MWHTNRFGSGIALISHDSHCGHGRQSPGTKCLWPSWSRSIRHKLKSYRVRWCHLQSLLANCCFVNVAHDFCVLHMIRHAAKSGSQPSGLLGWVGLSAWSKTQSPPQIRSPRIGDGSQPEARPVHVAWPPRVNQGLAPWHHDPQPNPIRATVRFLRFVLGQNLELRFQLVKWTLPRLSILFMFRWNTNQIDPNEKLIRDSSRGVTKLLKLPLTGFPPKVSISVAASRSPCERGTVLWTWSVVWRLSRRFEQHGTIEQIS